MSSEQQDYSGPEFDHQPAGEAARVGTPGKRPVTAGLAGRSQTNIIFRVESAEAARELAGAFGPRDPNGVAAGADAAVDRAAGSSGSSLPEDLRGRFESSLGTDLSSVRIHTGGASAEAATAVGAKAYTTGNDIHFNAGQYDPSSAFGVHLLAHEVAHTVQQAGAAPTRQNKLEVSSPRDGAEVEADRAADAMVSGASARIESSAPMTVHRASCTPGANDFNPGSCRPDAPMQDVHDGQKFYKPTNWLSMAGVSAVSLGDIPGGASYKPEFETVMHPAQAPFRAVASAVVATYNNLSGPITDYKEFAAKAEAADAPSGTKLHPEEPGDALDNTKASGAANTIKDSYAADHSGIKIDKSKVHAKNMDAQTHSDVKVVRDRIKRSNGEIAGKQANVVAKAQGVIAAIDVANGKQAGVQAALNNTELANLDQKKTGWKHDQGAFQDSVAIVRGAVGLVGSGAAMAAPGGGGVAGGVKVADSALDLVEAGGNAYFSVQIRKIEAQSAAIAVSNSALAEIAAYGEFSTARAGISAAIAELVEANNKFEEAKDTRTSDYTQLAVLIDKALEKNGATKMERDAVQSSVTAIPLMEEVIAKLDGIAAVAVLPAYNDQNGLGATHCVNLGGFLQLAGAVAGYQDAAKSDRVLWGKRLTAASDVTKQVR